MNIQQQVLKQELTISQIFHDSAERSSFRFESNIWMGIMADALSVY